MPLRCTCPSPARRRREGVRRGPAARHGPLVLGAEALARGLARPRRLSRATCNPGARRLRGYGSHVVPLGRLVRRKGDRRRRQSLPATLPSGRRRSGPRRGSSPRDKAPRSVPSPAARTPPAHPSATTDTGLCGIRCVNHAAAPAAMTTTRATGTPTRVAGRPCGRSNEGAGGAGFPEGDGCARGRASGSAEGPAPGTPRRRYRGGHAGSRLRVRRGCLRSPRTEASCGARAPRACRRRARRSTSRRRRTAQGPTTASDLSSRARRWAWRRRPVGPCRRSAT